MRQTILVCLLLLLVSMAGLPTARAANEYCDHPANLTVNCDMNSFSDRGSEGVRVVADGWNFWVEAGSLAFDMGLDSPVPPSQRIWSDGSAFTGGMYQKVSNLTPGATYVGGVVWAPYTSPDGSIMRQMGFDPTGGTNPAAPTVQWGPQVWPFSRLTLLELRAVATGPSMTFFIRIHNPRSHGADQVFIDGAWMRQDGNAPVPPPPANPPAPIPVPPSSVPSSGESAPPIMAGATCQFYMQTGGFSICDDGNARFLTAFRRYGLQNVGYPISQRYTRDGFITQAFQKAIFQWRADSGTVAFVNVFDDLHRVGLDQTLQERRQTPYQLPEGWEGANVPFQQAVQKRQGLLASRPALRAAYFSVSDPLTFFGLPTSEVTDMGNHYAVRTQRAVLQEWKENVPWARAGQVTIANGGDIAKELGNLPAFALTPESGSSTR